MEARLGFKHLGKKRGGGAAGAKDVVDEFHPAGAQCIGRAGGGLPSVEARAEETVFAVEFGVAVEVGFRPVVALIGEGFGEGGGEVDEPAAAPVSGVGLGGAAGPGEVGVGGNPKGFGGEDVDVGPPLVVKVHEVGAKDAGDEVFDGEVLGGGERDVPARFGRPAGVAIVEDGVEGEVGEARPKVGGVRIPFANLGAAKGEGIDPVGTGGGGVVGEEDGRGLHGGLAVLRVQVSQGRSGLPKWPWLVVRV